MVFYYSIFVILLRVSYTLAALDEDLVKYLTDMEARTEARARAREASMKTFIAEHIEFAIKELGKHSSNFTF